MAESTALRLERARSALALAEQAAGVASARLQAAGGGRVGQGPAAVVSMVPDAWEVPRGLRPILPGGLVKGMTLGVEGTRLATLLLASIPSRQGAWTACIGIDDMGWLGALRMGLGFERTVLVREVRPGVAGQVLAAAVDGFDVIAVGRNVKTDARERKLLARRALARGVVLLGEGWPERRRVAGRFLGVRGLDGGAGHIQSLEMEMSAPQGAAVRVNIDLRGWSTAPMLEVVGP